MAYEVVSRPKEDKPKYEIVSRPKQAEPAAASGPQPGGSVMEHYRRAVDQAVGGMREGAASMTAPGASMWDRTKGAGQAALGALGYVASPADAAFRRVVGNPAEVVARGMGASPETQVQAGDYASLISQLLGGAAAPKAVQAIPGMAREAMPLINRGANAAGRVMRSGVEAVDDMAQSALQGRQNRAAARAVDQAPSKDVLKTAGGGEFQAAKELGGDVKPEVLQGRIGGLRSRVGAADVDLQAEQTYPNARGMIDYLERRAADISSFKDLMGLQREARNFVKRARAAGVTSGDNSDYRAAQIAMKDLDDFIANLKPEDVTGGSPELANESLRKAKELWNRQGKMDVIESVVSKAKRMNDPEYLQQEFRKIALDDYEYERFTDAERKLIDDIAAEGVLDKVSDVATGTVGAIKKAAKIGGASVSPRIKKAEQLLKEVARGEAAQQAKAAAKASQPSFSERVNKVLRPEPENTRTRREGRFPYGR